MMLLSDERPLDTLLAELSIDLAKSCHTSGYRYFMRRRWRKISQGLGWYPIIPQHTLGLFQVLHEWKVAADAVQTASLAEHASQCQV